MLTTLDAAYTRYIEGRTDQPPPGFQPITV